MKKQKDEKNVKKERKKAAKKKIEKKMEECTRFLCTILSPISKKNLKKRLKISNPPKKKRGEINSNELKRFQDQARTRPDN